MTISASLLRPLSPLAGKKHSMWWESGSEGGIVMSVQGLVCSSLSLEEQGELFEEWFMQMFFAFCSPLED